MDNRLLEAYIPTTIIEQISQQSGIKEIITDYCVVTASSDFIVAGSS